MVQLELEAEFGIEWKSCHIGMVKYHALQARGGSTRLLAREYMKETSGRRRPELLEDEVTYLRSEIEEAVRMLAGVQAIVEEGRDILNKSPSADRLLADLNAFLHRHESAPRRQLWCVHVEGPNHAVPAPDQATAALWAGYINEAARQYFARSSSPNRQTIRAKPAIWPHSAADHAIGPSDEYRWLLRVKANR